MEVARIEGTDGATTVKEKIKAFAKEAGKDVAIKNQKKAGIKSK